MYYTSTRNAKINVSVHVGHVITTWLSCDYDVEQQEVKKNKVDKKEELGLRGSSI